MPGHLEGPGVADVHDDQLIALGPGPHDFLGEGVRNRIPDPPKLIVADQLTWPVVPKAAA